VTGKGREGGGEERCREKKQNRNKETKVMETIFPSLFMA